MFKALNAQSIASRLFLSAAFWSATGVCGRNWGKTRSTAMPNAVSSPLPPRYVA